MTLALLPPKMDFVFKRIFGNENRPNVLISFLNAVLTPVDPIKSVRLKDTTIEKSARLKRFQRNIHRLFLWDIQWGRYYHY